MGTALLVIVAILALLVLLLAVPFEVAFEVRGMRQFSGQVTIGWLWGLLRFRIPVSGKGGADEPHRAAGVRVRRTRRTGHDGGKKGNFMAVLRREDFRRQVYRLVRDILRAARLHDLGLQMRLGLGDPADTGRLWAFVGPLNAVAQNLNNARVSIEPEFMEAVMEFDTHGRFRIVPLQLLALATTFALSAPSRRAWRTLRGADA